jgi:uncharacterized protein (TIGR02265 family)
LLDAALTLYPDQPVREALRRLGRLAVPSLAQSIIGGVLLGTIGRNWEMALKLVSKGYEVSLSPGSARISQLGKGHAVLELRDVWNFGDSYQVGVVEGLMNWCDIAGTAQPVLLSRGSVDLTLSWSHERTTALAGSANARPAGAR